VTTPVGVVPAIHSRVYGQCAWFVAYKRLSFGKLPSTSAYSGYANITTSWTPATGDQLQWQGVHTAIITGVSPVAVKGNTKTWTLNVEEYNADCRNSWHQYPTTFSVIGNSITYPQSSVRSYGSATQYYR